MLSEEVTALVANDVIQSLLSSVDEKVSYGSYDRF